jgi:hypothetical protein
VEGGLKAVLAHGALDALVAAAEGRLGGGGEDGGEAGGAVERVDVHVGAGGAQQHTAVGAEVEVAQGVH